MTSCDIFVDAWMPKETEFQSDAKHCYLCEDFLRNCIVCDNCTYTVILSDTLFLSVNVIFVNK